MRLNRRAGLIPSAGYALVNLMSDESKPVRVFIALPVPAEVRQRLAEFQSAWRAAAPGRYIRWTPLEQMHLTLRFVGHVPPEALRELEAALRRACTGVSAFELSATGSGCFPNPRRPRVLWVGIGGDWDALTRLQSRVLCETRAWGEIENREFRAHLTLGRVKEAPPPVSRKIARRAQSLTCGELGRWRADVAWLMRSELSPEGAHHTMLAACQLCG